MLQSVQTMLKLAMPNVSQMEMLVNEECSKAIKLVDDPCGRYKITKSIVQTFYNTANLTTDHIKDFITFVEAPGYTPRNPFYNLLVIYILVFLANNNIEAAKQVSRYYASVSLSYLKLIFFPICDAEALRYTMMHLHGSSIAKEGFSVLVVKVADETLMKYAHNFLDRVNAYDYYRFIIDIRTKLFQATRIIARRYYAYKSSERETSLETQIDELMLTWYNLINRPDIVDWVAQIANASPVEVEQLFISMQGNEDSFAYMQSVLTKILTQLGGVDNIHPEQSTLLISRAMRTNVIVEACRDFTDILQLEPTRENMASIVGLALVMVFAYRKE